MNGSDLFEKFTSLGRQVGALADNWLPPNTKETVILRGFTLMRIPLVAFLGPRVNRSDDEAVEITIPLDYRSKNHLGSMYFGALATGADLALGFTAFREIQKRELPIQLVFKSLHADFLKRAEADVRFSFKQVGELRAMIEECLQSGERVTRDFDVVATTPFISGDEPVAQFRLGLSLKKRG